MALAAACVALSACGEKSTPDTGNASVGQRLDQPTEKIGSSSGRAVDSAIQVDDAAVLAKVKAALLAEPELSAAHITVASKDGTITLSGTVDTKELREKAKLLTASTPGVGGVIDQLSVKTS